MALGTACERAFGSDREAILERRARQVPDEICFIISEAVGGRALARI